MATKKKPDLDIKKLLIGGAAYALLFFHAAGNITGTDSDPQCGGDELWDLKVLKGQAADGVPSTATPTTIADLNSIKTTGKRAGEFTRLSFEKKKVKLHNVLIRKVLREDDNDY